MLPHPNSGNGAGLYDNASLVPFGERSGSVPISQAPACMSEYEYYEFLAIDKSLDDGALLALRALSSRARITRANFSVHYNWGNFKGKPDEMMKRWFDLHVFVGMGSRRLMIRLPKRLVDHTRWERLLNGTGLAEILDAGENFILDIHQELEPTDYYEFDEGDAWMPELAPLRSDLLAGDLRLAYLFWLDEVEKGHVPQNVREPLPGIGPLTSGLETLAEFLQIDQDLVHAAAERMDPGAQPLSGQSVRSTLEALSDSERIQLLQRVAENDPQVAAEIRQRVRQDLAVGSVLEFRSVSDLRQRVEEIRTARATEKAKREERERLKRERLEAQQLKERLDRLRTRVPETWQEIDAAVKTRTTGNYDRAAALITDLRALADRDGDKTDFLWRLQSLRERHHRKLRFIERLSGETP